MPPSASGSASPLSNTMPVSPSLFKSIFLHEWWLVKPQPQCEGLAVGGVASLDGRERVFFSTLIAKRHEANVLETQDGITIVFRGFINVSRTSQNGFPSEVFHHFMFGFPHDWSKYSVHSYGDKYLDEATGFDNPNACSQNRADDVVPISIHDNHLTMAEDFMLSNNGNLDYCSALKQVGNELGDSLGNVSKQSQSIDDMECNAAVKIVECECKDNLMGMYDHPNPCSTVLSSKSTVKSSISTKKMRKGRLSFVCKEKQFIRENISEDAVNTCSSSSSSRMVTRSISRSHLVHQKDDNFTVAPASSPVRRSPRLYNCRKLPVPSKIHK